MPPKRVIGIDAGGTKLLGGVVDEDLVVHELCHVWQDQHRRWRMWTSYLYQGYRNNPHEVEARRAAAETR